MKKISELYHFENKWYDYPVAREARHEQYKVNTPKPFRVYHIDRTFDLAYSYGEYNYTFDQVELKLARERYQTERAEKSERSKLLKQFEALDTDILKKLLELVK